MNETTLPATLAEAMLTEPWWLQMWLLLLVAANVLAIPFLLRRVDSRWAIQREAVFIVISFIVAAMIMDWMYLNFGYVRLLGLAHLIAWSPAYLYVLLSRQRIGLQDWFGKYIHFYLLIAGVSLFIDALDVIRFLVGDGELYLRWAQ